jgi:hypothetical protein
MLKLRKLKELRMLRMLLVKVILKSSMVRASALLVALILCAGPAAATPVLEVLSGSDGNFSYSWIHTSTGGSDGQSGSLLDAIGLGGAGGDITVSGAGTLLDVDVELAIGTGTYDAIGQFDLAGLLDDTTQADVLLGTLTLSHVAGTAEYDGLKFYFEDRNYSSASLKPNSLNGDTLSLWGATAFTSPVTDPGIGDALDLNSGGTGIDLRMRFGGSPVPEPSAAAVFAIGLAVMGHVTRKGSTASRKR